jgi:NAD(P)H-dependent flavin oxidoreductase YrpB (nitropropane dioxygenase family)
MISTRLTQRFGIRHPIICAPMAYVTGGALAAAVSRAGGLGIVGGAYAGTVGGAGGTRCLPNHFQSSMERAWLGTSGQWSSSSHKMRCFNNFVK